MQKKVVILGGGVAGLSAAHELIERGFAVEVYEAKKIPGGKARSIPVPNTGSMGPNGPRKPLPGEHGFRFFPRFYKHIVDTMARIPYGKDKTVADNLVDTTRVEMARYGQRPIVFPSRSPRTFADVQEILNEFPTIFGPDFGVSPEEIAFFATKVWQIVTSCEERRLAEYEKEDWWEFVGADQRSPAYQKIFGHGITRSLVAAKAHLASTKTIGDIFVQLLFDLVEPGPSSDRVLNAPTNDAWINPWIAYLTQQGVQYHLEAKVLEIHCTNGQIQGATIEHNGHTFTVQGDYYIAAVPVERMAELITESIKAADPGLGILQKLSEGGVSWMNGIQLYLTEDVPLSHGHAIYVDSPWALTSISQRQFWPGVDFSQYADGRIKGIISVDISEWDEKALNGKTAKECTREEVKNEVWAQLKKSINIHGQDILKDEYLDHWFLDPAIYLVEGEGDTNEEPLLVNLINTWAKRPEAVTAIPNLFLASDYVRTYTDLATMEGANEAARRAVNGIIAAAQADVPQCKLWKLHEQEIFEPWRVIDRIRFHQGLPWDDSLVRWGLSALKLAHQGGRILEQLLGVTIDQPLEKFGNPLYTIGTQGFDNIELRQELMEVVQKSVLDIVVQMAESQTMPEMIPDLSALQTLSQPSPPAATQTSTRTGKVHIIPSP
ncbi:FAD-dependent oxidoreductase [Acaryochloris sp. IP29b_bin.137]|uniref:hydroxysqualene dehydroxylase n=1 Tax=Acaryochloris sp. IP29b_bin.137 TaxID=2969217 RepID=UPI00261D80BA|nr:FAD-dependent oxidoreductase [Acaryochloris sp. IP29b_bin.137]